MHSLSNFVKHLRDIMRNDAGINGDAQRIEQIAWMLFLKVYDAKEQDWDMAEDNYLSIIPAECRWCNWAVDDKSGSAMTGDTLLNFVNNTLFPVLKGQNVLDGNGKIKIKGIVITPDMPIKKSIVKTTFDDANNYMKDGVLLRQIINVIDELDLSDYEESHAFGEIYESILRELQSAGSAGEFYTPRPVTEFMARMIAPKIGETMADFACGTGALSQAGSISSRRRLRPRKIKRPTTIPSTAWRKSSSRICCASRICCCTGWMYRAFTTATPYCGMCWITPRTTSSTSS